MSYEKEETNIYKLANEWVGSIKPEESNVIFLPFLNGSNEDALAKGTFIGLTAYHNKKHMLRAVYEGVVFSHLTHVNKLLKNRNKPKSIRLSGGAANSDVWVQIFADVLQISIDVVADKESGALGAAMAAGIAAGIYMDYTEAIGKTVSILKTVQPREAYKGIYEEKYATYRAVVDALTNEKVWQHFKN
jgi:L-xylulokinase